MEDNKFCNYRTAINSSKYEEFKEFISTLPDIKIVSFDYRDGYILLNLCIPTQIKKSLDIKILNFL